MILPKANFCKHSLMWYALHELCRLQGIIDAIATRVENPFSNTSLQYRLLFIKRSNIQDEFK